MGMVMRISFRGGELLLFEIIKINRTLERRKMPVHECFVPSLP
jgi:hypothetical protein